MQTHEKLPALRGALTDFSHALTPKTLLKDSGRAIGVGAVTGAVAGAVAGALAGAAAWSMWVIGREAVKVVRERTRP